MMITVTYDCNTCNHKSTCKIDKPLDRITSSIPGGKFTISVCNDGNITRVRLDTLSGSPIIDNVTSNAHIPRTMVIKCIKQATSNVMG